jgi:ribonucleoside-diphosphate reductase alpha chain
MDPNSEGFKKHLVTAQTLTPNDHLVMQAAVQKWVDSSISKTINCPKDIPFEDFKAVYISAYELGLKGCTTYRPNDTLGSVLEIVEDEQDAEYLAEEGPVDQPVEDWEMKTVLTSRVNVLNGQTYKLKWKGSNFYVTINNEVIDGKVSPFEIFINTQNMDNFQWIVALTRMMSSVFRRGGDISFMVEDLKSIMDPNGGEFVAGKYQHSFIAYLGRIVQEHLDFLEGEGNHDDKMHAAAWSNLLNEAVEENGPVPDRCEECGEYAVVQTGQSCPPCLECGHSKCG